MKKLCFPLMTAALALLSAGCYFSHGPVGVAGKELILPAQAGEKSKPVGGFIALGDRWASEQTQVFATLNGDKIKFEIVCFGKTADLEWSAKKPADDMTLFGGEHVELLIAPFGLNENGQYYHIALNPAGSVYHANKRDTAWTPEVTCGTTVKADRWIATIEIPHTNLTLDKTGATGTMWNVNFCRTIKKKGKEAEHTSWTGSSNFHDIPSMGQLHFNKAELPDQLEIFCCRATKNGQLELNIRKTGKEHGYLQIYDNGEFVTSLKLKGTDPLVSTIALKNNYVALKGTKKLELYLLGPYRVPIQDFSASIAAFEEDFLRLDKLEYINAKEMVCRVHVFPGKLAVKSDGKLLREQAVTGKTAKLSLDGLEPGRYELEYTSGNLRTSRVFFVRTAPVEALPDMPEKGKLTVDGKDLQLDKKPFFLLGISAGSKTYYPVNPGFSLIYGKGWRKNALSYRGVPGRRLVWKPATGYAFSKNWEAVILKHMKNVGKAEKSSWNYLCYEANLAVIHPDENGKLQVDPDGHKIYEKIYKMAKKEAPDAVFSIHIDNMSVVKQFAEYCDVLEYASGNSSYHRTNMIEKFGSDFDYVRSLAGDKPLVIWLGGTIPSSDCRSAEEIRAGVYYTILKGGAGNIIHMGHGGMPADRTRFWSMLSMLPREVEAIYSDLKTWKEVAVKLPNSLIGKAVIGPEGQLLLVVLNTTTGEVQTEIEVPGFGKKKLTFTPLEPRVIRESAPKPPEKEEEKQPEAK